MQAEPRPEHRWLQRLAGEWTYEGESAGEGGGPPSRHTGTERVRALGGVWMVCEMRGDAPVADAESIMTLGYDPDAGRFVGTFVSSMMTYLWRYEGRLDADGTTLTLDAEGPSLTEEGKTGRYRDVIRLDGDDRRTFTSTFLADDGRWREFMTMHYRRIAPA